MDDVAQFVEHVRYRIGSRAVHVGATRCSELTRLVVMHWPHRHLEDALADGRSAKGIDHAMVLLRASVREHWEMTHGIGPIWAMLMAPTVAAIAQVVLDLWANDRAWAVRLEEMGKRLRKGN